MRGIAASLAALLTAAGATNVALAGTTERVSDANGGFSPVVSGDATIVAFSRGAGSAENRYCPVFLAKGGTLSVIQIADSCGDYAISRDGRYFLLANGTFGVSPFIILLNLETGKSRQLTADINVSQDAKLSATGRFAQFDSDETDLVPHDTNGATDVFVYDRKLGRTERVSVGPNGRQANSDSYSSAISGDGRFAVFSSYATNLVAGDANQKSDVFLRDRRLRTTERISVATGGGQGNGDSYGGLISDDGRIIAFNSYATNLVPGDRNGKQDVFVRDRQARTTVRISLAPNGGEANGDSFVTSLSPDGRLVVFQSDATNLVPGDTNGATDVFLYDRQTRTTQRASVTSAGRQGDGRSGNGTISADGKVIVFDSDADNLVKHDTNGNTDVFARVR